MKSTENSTQNAATKNRLQHESSPYLKQHEYNPVDWFPWGEEALLRAKHEDKPILLSIGYSACHWCHVMAHESFENPAIAKIMNEHFINIKVDREERPDLDQIYQTVAQVMTQGGGWPLTVFLTPDHKPFYGGTYFPPSDRYGRPGFPKVLMALADSYKTKRASIEERAEKFTEVIRNHGEEDLGLSVKVETDRRTALLQSARNLCTYLDWQNGGIGSAPKFPNTTALTFLWRMSLASFVEENDRKIFREGVLLALEKMRKGGIFDQLGGGFSRYSVDATWSVPHFEKMLYDNALLLKLYSEVLLHPAELTAEQRYLFTSALEMTITYLKREMISPDGLFYAAQDADSEGEEGKFFAWTKAEIESHLTPAEAAIFCSYYGVTESGNFEHGTTVLAIRAATVGELNASDRELLTSAEQKLFSIREKRIRPGLDSKALTAWNGLMISGLSWATLALNSLGLDSSDSRQMAMTAFQAIQKKALHSGGLFATVQEGQGKIGAFLDDYVFIANAALDLARIDSDRADAYFEFAKQQLRTVQKNFAVEKGTGFYFAEATEELIHRPKSLFDQAIPSGTGMAYGLLAVLNSVDETISSTLERDRQKLLPLLSENAFGMSEVLNSLLLEEIGPVTVKGKPGEEVLANPAVFLISTKWDEKLGKAQYCHRQTCVVDAFPL